MFVARILLFQIFEQFGLRFPGLSTVLGCWQILLADVSFELVIVLILGEVEFYLFAGGLVVDLFESRNLFQH